MEIWADFCERAFGITREELFRWTAADRDHRQPLRHPWFLVHGPPEEAIAAFHLGPPPQRASAWARPRSALGRAAWPARACQPLAARTRHPLTAAFERLGIDPDLADYFFRLHREIEPFEQDEGWAYVPEVVRTGPQRRASSAPTSARSSPSGARTKACCGA